MLHLRVQAELWESRPVWDRLVYPAIVRVFRLGARAGRRRVDHRCTGAVDDAMPAAAESAAVACSTWASSDRVSASERYYVHVVATLGTLAEREVDDVGDAVFGRPSETNGLGSLGRLVFRTVLQVSDYLQSVTAETVAGSW